MHLSRKLGLISTSDPVLELREMLKSAHVGISWYGQRVVSVDGYEGVVKN